MPGSSRGDRERVEHPPAELVVAARPRPRPGSGARRPPASRTNASRSSRSAHRRVGRHRRQPLAAARVGDRRTPPARWPPTSSTAVVPGRRADPLGRARSRGSRRGTSAVCARARRSPCRRAADRAADVLLVHPHVERAVAQQRAPSPADAAEDPLRASADAVGGRVGEQGGVPRGGGRADLVDERVGGARRAGRPRPTRCRGPSARSRAPGSPTSTVSSGLPARIASRCAVCAATACTSQPGRSVGRRPLLGRHLLEQVGEVVDRLPPDVDVLRQPFPIGHERQPKGAPRGGQPPVRGGPASMRRRDARVGAACRDPGQWSACVSGPRARRPRLAEHRRPRLAARPARPLRPARLLDLLLRQLPARHRRAAPAGGEVRRRAGRRRRALAEVRARGRPGRAGRRRSSATPSTTPSSTTPSWSPGRPTPPGPGRRWCSSTRRATSSRSTPARATPTRSTRCSATWSRSTGRRGRCSPATRRTSPPTVEPTDLRFPAKAVPPRTTGDVLVADAGHDEVVELDRRGPRWSAASAASASPTACACCPPRWRPRWGTTSWSPTPSTTSCAASRSASGEVRVLAGDGAPVDAGRRHRPALQPVGRGLVAGPGLDRDGRHPPAVDLRPAHRRGRGGRRHHQRGAARRPGSPRRGSRRPPAWRPTATGSGSPTARPRRCAGSRRLAGRAGRDPHRGRHRPVRLRLPRRRRPARRCSSTRSA